MEQSLVLTALSALAHGTRLDLVRLLVAAGKQGVAQGDLARRLATSASGLSFHLALLEQAGLVLARRQSRHVYYAANTANIGRVLGYILNDCCASDPEVAACCHGHCRTPTGAGTGPT